MCIRDSALVVPNVASSTIAAIDTRIVPLLIAAVRLLVGQRECISAAFLSRARLPKWGQERTKSPAGAVRSALGPFGGGLLIGRQHGRIVIACDACGRTFEGDSDGWIDVWPQARRIGERARLARTGANSAGPCVYLTLPTIKSGRRHECFSGSFDLTQPQRLVRGAECERRPVPAIPLPGDACRSLKAESAYRQCMATT